MNEPSLRRLEVESEVRAQLGRVARLLDGKRWSELGEVFAEDVAFDYGDGNGVQQGLALLRDTFVRHLDRCGATQHLLGSIIVTVEGGSAVSETYVQARHAGTGAVAGEIFDSSGEYVDTWVVDADKPRIVRRDVRWFTLSGNPAVVGM